eukprot:scaffold17001_cov64-Phaeocystis_antarctica.AAC.4
MHAPCMPHVLAVPVPRLWHAYPPTLRLPSVGTSKTLSCSCGASDEWSGSGSSRAWSGLGLGGSSRACSPRSEASEACSAEISYIPGIKTSTAPGPRVASRCATCHIRATARGDVSVQRAAGHPLAHTHAAGSA